MIDFSGISVVITGAGQGIGLEIARQLVLSGASVLLNDIDPVLAGNACTAITQNTPSANCISYPGDASDAKFITEMVQKAVTQFGKLDIAIANAGITLFGDFFAYTPEAFSRVMQVNLNGSFFLAQSAAIQMKQQGGGGSILLLSSVTGHQAHKNLAAYGMSKAALEMMARNLVVELSPYQITINTIAPGATMTERTALDSDYNKTWSKLTPMGKPATVADIASAALFLISPAAKHITGQSLVVDGGWTSVSPQP